ncbi:MAG: type II 3-dehydroquinate dehydratase [SAR324 cluster bacterium]|nr:type II 3-dehydroquinate dehydratase [SAR324 cluster bacterium]
MATVLLLNGPNLKALGKREPEIYGKTTLAEIEDKVRGLVENDGHAFRCFQSNSEGEMVDWIHHNQGADFLLFNGAALTHTSIALRDALKFTGIPFVEIHISNVYARESFRHHSYFSDIAQGVIVGLGVMGYELAVRFALDFLSRRP